MHKLCKYASELEWSGGRWSRVEVDGVRGSQGWAEKGKGGRTMTGGRSRRSRMCRGGSQRINNIPNFELLPLLDNFLMCSVS